MTMAKKELGEKHKKVLVKEYIGGNTCWGIYESASADSSEMLTRTATKGERTPNQKREK